MNQGFFMNDIQLFPKFQRIIVCFPHSRMKLFVRWPVLGEWTMDRSQPLQWIFSLPIPLNIEILYSGSWKKEMSLDFRNQSDIIQSWSRDSRRKNRSLYSIHEKWSIVCRWAGTDMFESCIKTFYLCLSSRLEVKVEDDHLIDCMPICLKNMLNNCEKLMSWHVIWDEINFDTSQDLTINNQIMERLDGDTHVTKA